GGGLLLRLFTSFRGGEEAVRERVPVRFSESSAYCRSDATASHAGGTNLSFAVSAAGKHVRRLMVAASPLATCVWTFFAHRPEYTCSYRLVAYCLITHQYND